ncbi:flavodoxin domain-containing protein [Gracilibacillus kekensis]|uniref:Flavodoxin I n=1 Tax=Gracilibacillus kekensis TaxID=1027249 RepID=A0A1M7PYI6_9BACI|nr:flavodoxin domain-containing protein [Gracilibacillus kekensis]SHN22770.1 flavodoxin I [Gracilibacillus kekensis]
MKAAIIYTSVTGNTSTLAEIIHDKMEKRDIDTDLIPIEDFQPHLLKQYDIVAVGTYSWDNGDLPMEMEDLFESFETADLKHVTTGVFGTGDSFYPYYCGAVDLFRDMLFVHTNLAVTLKVELTPQDDDLDRCEKFCDRLSKELAVVS